MKRLESGMDIDGFILGERVHAGGMAHIWRVAYANPDRIPPFPLAMKVPRMTPGDGAENIVSFEVEQQVLRVLAGAHVPRFVAAGDLSRTPYLVMEYIEGRPLQRWLDEAAASCVPMAPQEIARLGAAVAAAAHSLHLQDCVHLDLKPANVMIKDDATAVLVDFGLAWHAHYPDLLAEETRLPVGSAPWMAPEQVVGIRGDPRSDIFAIGVMLYEMATGELPFGDPQTRGGLRQRLWMEPVPPRALAPQMPSWLQEIILRCLEPEAARRYPTAAQLAFDLAHPQQVIVTARGERVARESPGARLRRWLKAAGLSYQPSPLPSTRVHEAPIVMVAVPWRDASDATLYSLREAAQRSLQIRPGARLACVTVVAPGDIDHLVPGRGQPDVHRLQLDRLRQWAQGLDLSERAVSYHAIEAGDTAAALLQYARSNAVDLVIAGAATHGLMLQRLIATIPMRIAMEAPCSVLLVKQGLPFEHLARAADGDNAA